ncbi:MAG: hypothetical protein NZO58_11290 [Gemmataceae bacterium]|nr:hypothetical protein [Gemmataceae bacterium]
MVYLYLGSALIWAVVAACMWMLPQFSAVTVGNTGLSLAWLPVLFVCYNLFRAWRVRRRRRPTPVAKPAPRPVPDVYHPEFDFSRPEEPRER